MYESTKVRPECGVRNRTPLRINVRGYESTIGVRDPDHRAQLPLHSLDPAQDPLLPLEKPLVPSGWAQLAPITMGSFGLDIQSEPLYSLPVKN